MVEEEEKLEIPEDASTEEALEIINAAEAEAAAEDTTTEGTTDDESNEETPYEEEGVQEEEKVDEEENPIVKKFKAAGQEFEFTQEEINENFEESFKKSLDYIKKTQVLSPWRKSIYALEENGMSHEDINLLIEAKKGNKDAIAALMKEADIDPLDVDIDEDFSYTPKEYGLDDKQLELREVISEIKKDEHYENTANVVDSQWDAESRNILGNNPNLLRGLHNDVKSGLYNKVAPLAIKLKLADGGSRSDIEYYVEAGQKVVQDSSPTTSTENAKKQYDKESKFDEEKRAASTTSRRTGTGVRDYLEEIDEDAFNKWYKNLDN